MPQLCTYFSQYGACKVVEPQQEGVLVTVISLLRANSLPVVRETVITNTMLANGAPAWGQMATLQMENEEHPTQQSHITKRKHGATQVSQK